MNLGCTLANDILQLMFSGKDEMFNQRSINWDGVLRGTVHQKWLNRRRVF